MQLSKRAEQLGTEPAFEVLADIGKLAKKGKNILSLCIGQPDFDPPEHVLDVVENSLRKDIHQYTPSAGLESLRKAAAKYFTDTRAVAIPADDIVIACGAKPFLEYTIASVTDYGAGHEVIYPNPGYPIYHSQIVAQGAVPVAFDLRESNSFGFDVDELARKLTHKTRLLILNSPSNPTGSTLSYDALKDIAALLQKYPNVWVLSDEVYSAFTYGKSFVSIASLPGMRERTVVIDSISKTFGMTGWRIGYASNPVLAPVFTKWVTNTQSCAPNISQIAALAALEGSQDTLEKNRSSFRERRDLVVNELNSIAGVHCQKPTGAFFAWPNVTKLCEVLGCKDAESLRLRLLNEANVALLSDIHFGEPVAEDGAHLRLSYASPLSVIKQAFEQIHRFIENHKIPSNVLQTRCLVSQN
jgi:aspartate aminotransferase